AGPGPDAERGPARRHRGRVPHDLPGSGPRGLRAFPRPGGRGGRRRTHEGRQRQRRRRGAAA
ncbi:unnamed protein product, partial [Heterosigma akashiwo]